MLKVMLVEDDETTLKLLSTLFEIEGYQVARLTTEKTVSELMTTIRREKPDVTLVDVHLQNVSGTDLLTNLRHDPDLRATKVLMCSGLDMSEECRKAGADDFILKPYMPDELLKRIRRVLE